MERRKKRVKVAISAEKLSIGKTENSLESVLCSSKLCVLIVFLNLFKYRSSCLSNVYLITIAGNLVDYPHLVFLERHRLVSDVRTVCMPCCCRQRRRVSDSPFTCGSTTVDLISGAGSFGDIHFFGLVTFFKKENG